MKVYVCNQVNDMNKQLGLIEKEIKSSTNNLQEKKKNIQKEKSLLIKNIQKSLNDPELHIIEKINLWFHFSDDYEEEGDGSYLEGPVYEFIGIEDSEVPKGKVFDIKESMESLYLKGRFGQSVIADYNSIGEVEANEIQKVKELYEELSTEDKERITLLINHVLELNLSTYTYDW